MKILVIEDDKFFQKFYNSKLTERGFQVDVAEDGEDGLEKICDFKPDVILLDIIMPKKDGFEVLQILQKNTQLKTIPVLVFSTLGQEEDVKRAMSLGAKDYVNKSFFDIDKLINKINSIMANKNPA